MTVSNRAFNFSAGPAAMPTAVLERAQAELLNWQGLGVSVMESSHRGADFMEVVERSETNVRALLNIPDNYRVLFMAGGATHQFTAIPFNLLGENQSADLLNSGHWSAKCLKEMRRYGAINEVACWDKGDTYTLPDPSSWALNCDAAFFHCTPNETISGLELHSLPEVGDVPIIADMSSTIMSRPIDVSQYGMIYAGAQKNIGPSGLTLVIIRDDLLGRARALTPTLFNYQHTAETRSLSNTPPTFAWYLADLVFQWLLEQGGLAVMAERNRVKAETLYRCLDESAAYVNRVDPKYRSWMNVSFEINGADQSPEFNQRFLKAANEAGLLNLKGHSSVGGMRASIYNAVTQETVDALVEFLKHFEKEEM